MVKYIDVDQTAVSKGAPDVINIRMRRTARPGCPDEFVCIKANDILVSGRSEVRYCPTRPMEFGARVWIETDGVVMYKSSELLDWQRIS